MAKKPFASRLLGALTRALRFLTLEVMVFTMGVMAAENSPEVAATLAKKCVSHIKNALDALTVLMDEIDDEHLKHAREQLVMAGELFESVIFEVASPRGGKPVYLLDCAHSEVHEAIKTISRSPVASELRDILDLLQQAREDSAPMSLYRLAYEKIASANHPHYI